MTTSIKSPWSGINFLFSVRILIGAFFIVIGIDKVMSPYQNFLYVVQAYQLFPEPLENIVARVFPWMELFLGIFLFLGLYLRWTIRAFLLILSAFILIITQALVRKLPLESCGCFGGLFSSDIQTTLLLDLSLWFFCYLMLKTPEKTSYLSLDRYFEKTEK